MHHFEKKGEGKEDIFSQPWVKRSNLLSFGVSAVMMCSREECVLCGCENNASCVSCQPVLPQQNRALSDSSTKDLLIVAPR